MVHAADESKVRSSRLGWLYRSCEEWTTACLFFEGRVEDKEIWGINH